MSISDIITLLSLVIAIIAIISEKNRTLILVKFRKSQFYILMISFLLINYFAFYDQFYSKGWYLKFLYFDSFGLKNPKLYSYIITILSLFFIFYKIVFSFFPASKRDKVIKYYQRLIENNDSTYLLDLIERFHLKEIKLYLAKEKEPILSQLDKLSLEYEENKKSKIRLVKSRIKGTISKYVKPQLQHKLRNYLRFSFSVENKMNYAQLAYYNFVIDPTFIEKTTTIRPYFFAEIISSINKNNRIDDESIQKYFFELISERNYFLVKELKESCNIDGGQPPSFFIENRIISSILKDVTIAKKSEIWLPFGELALEELKNEGYKKEQSLLNREFDSNDNVLWNYKCYLSIVFFKVMITESIVQKFEKAHFWLFYYNHFTMQIIDNLKHIEKKSENEQSINLYERLIQIMNNNLFQWIELAKENKNSRYISCITCIGQQIHFITETEFLRKSFKLELLDRVLDQCIHLYENDDTLLIVNRYKEILLRPYSLTESNHSYFTLIGEAWERLDKEKHKNHEFEYYENFKTEVIVKLGLNPDAY